MNAKQLMVAGMLIALFISCNGTKKENAADISLAELKKEAPGNSGLVEDLQLLATDTSGTTQSPATPVSSNTIKTPGAEWDKKIIKTGTLRLEVKNFRKYNEAVHRTIKQFGCYIAQEEQTLNDEKSETAMTIKVPVAQFEEMMNQLPDDSSKIMERKISTDDVTGEMVDIKSRLETKRQTRLKYLELLNQSKNMEEILKVQQEINEIQEQIESAGGRVNFLSHQSALSTINLVFYKPVEGFTPVENNKPGFFTRVSSAFKIGVDWIADLFVGIMSIWPLALLFVLAFTFWKRSRNSRPVKQNA